MGLDFKALHLSGKDIAAALEQEHQEIQRQLQEKSPDGKPVNRWRLAAEQIKKEEFLKGEMEEIRKLNREFREGFAF